MEFIASLLKDQAPQLISLLTSKGGLGQDEAERFVPEAAQATVDQLQNAEGLDLSSLLEGGDASSLLERFASRENFDYAGKALSAMRMQFGGHHEKKR